MYYRSTLYNISVRLCRRIFDFCPGPSKWFVSITNIEHIRKPRVCDQTFDKHFGKFIACVGCLSSYYSAYKLDILDFSIVIYNQVIGIRSVFFEKKMLAVSWYYMRLIWFVKRFFAIFYITSYFNMKLTWYMKCVVFYFVWNKVSVGSYKKCKLSP